LSDFDLDARLQHYWLKGDADQANHIVQAALSSPPATVKSATRALQIMEALERDLKPRVQGDIAEFRAYVGSLIFRLAQVDAIGNLETDPRAALFEVLGEESDSLGLEGFEPAGLHRRRIGASSRADAAAAFFQAFGWERLPESSVRELKQAIADLRAEQRRFRSQALFVDSNGQGFVLGVSVSPSKSPGIRTPAQVDNSMKAQAEKALREVLGKQGAEWDIEWPFPFEGESIGLGLYVAALVKTGKLPEDALTAATGKIEVGGHARGVGGIPAKLEAAWRSGIRRVVLPEENREEAESLGVGSKLELIFVDRVGETHAKLLKTSSGREELGFEASIRLCRRLLPLYSLALEDERPVADGYQLIVGDGSSQATITLYSKRGNAVIGGSTGSAREAAERLNEEHLKAERPVLQPTRTFRIPTTARQDEARRLLAERGAFEIDCGTEYEAWHVRLPHGASNVTVVLYTSNKCVVQGSSPAFDDAVGAIAQALEGLGGSNGREAPASKATGLSALPDVPRIGTDESGKGDYFGPLVSAAVFVTPEIGAELKRLGVRDSKRMTDKAIRKLAPQLRHVLGDRFAVTLIGPKRYNELYRTMRGEGKNLNTLLAWGHARSLEDLLGKGVRPEFVIVDQFADVHYIEQKILADTRQSGVPIKQFPKAEADIAVAAASVLAREKFLGWLQRESERLKVTLPKGASDRVIEVARELVARDGKEKLGDIAKLAFKTTDKVLSS
jgi:ribonuclease HIII